MQRIPSSRRLEFQMAYDSQKKDGTTAFLLSLFLGFLGIDRFYSGQTVLGILKLITFGGFYIWWFIDLFLIKSAIEKHNLETIQHLSMLNWTSEA